MTIEGSIIEQFRLARDSGNAKQVDLVTKLYECFVTLQKMGLHEIDVQNATNLDANETSKPQISEGCSLEEIGRFIVRLGLRRRLRNALLNAYGISTLTPTALLYKKVPGNSPLDHFHQEFPEPNEGDEDALIYINNIGPKGIAEIRSRLREVEEKGLLIPEEQVPVSIDLDDFDKEEQRQKRRAWYKRCSQGTEVGKLK